MVIRFVSNNCFQSSIQQIQLYRKQMKFHDFPFEHYCYLRICSNKMINGSKTFLRWILTTLPIMHPFYVGRVTWRMSTGAAPLLAAGSMSWIGDKRLQNSFFFLKQCEHAFLDNYKSGNWSQLVCFENTRRLIWLETCSYCIP